MSKSKRPSISQDTRAFAFYILKEWGSLVEAGEHPELIRNLVYASLVLYYNLIFSRKMTGDANSILNEEGVEKIVDVLT